MAESFMYTVFKKGTFVKKKTHHDRHDNFINRENGEVK